jgi:hypothetical protein
MKNTLSYIHTYQFGHSFAFQKDYEHDHLCTEKHDTGLEDALFIFAELPLEWLWCRRVDRVVIG